MVDNNEEYPGNRLKNVSRSSFNGQPLMLSKTDRRLVIRLEKRFNCFVEQFCFLFFFSLSLYPTSVSAGVRGRYCLQSLAERSKPSLTQLTIKSEITSCQRFQSKNKKCSAH